MTAAAKIKQSDLDRCVKAAVRGSGLSPGHFKIKVNAVDGTVEVLPTTTEAPKAEPTRFELARAAQNGQRAT